MKDSLQDYASFTYMQVCGGGWFAPMAVVHAFLEGAMAVHTDDMHV